jgi:hypothetical protein
MEARSTPCLDLIPVRGGTQSTGYRHCGAALELALYGSHFRTIVIRKLLLYLLAIMLGYSAMVLAVAPVEAYSLVLWLSIHSSFFLFWT